MPGWLKSALWGIAVAGSGVVAADLCAHPVEQILVKLGEEIGGWEAEVLFDAAYALPEFREDTDEPAPEREWLVNLSEKEHARIRAGAEAFLRERLRFHVGDTEMGWGVSFPDFESAPPAFPKLLNGGAYTRVKLRGEAGSAKGELSLEVIGAGGPKMVIAIGPEGGLRYVTVAPEEKAGLLEIRGRREVAWWRWGVVAAAVGAAGLIGLSRMVRRSKQARE